MIREESTSDLTHYRKRMKFTQSHVMRLLGWKNKKGLWRIESGNVTPTLRTALKLSIIYRVPTDFLFRDLYHRLHKHIRAEETALVPVRQQQELPLTYTRHHDS